MFHSRNLAGRRRCNFIIIKAHVDDSYGYKSRHMERVTAATSIGPFFPFSPCKFTTNLFKGTEISNPRFSALGPDKEACGREQVNAHRKIGGLLTFCPCNIPRLLMKILTAEEFGS